MTASQEVCERPGMPVQANRDPLIHHSREALKASRFLSHLIDYLHEEGEVDLSPEDLTFIGSEEIDGTEYCIWSFVGDALDTRHVVAWQELSGRKRFRYEPT